MVCVDRILSVLTVYGLWDCIWSVWAAYCLCGLYTVCVNRIWSVWTVYGVCEPHIVCVDCIWSVWTVYGLCGLYMVCVDLAVADSCMP